MTRFFCVTRERFALSNDALATACRSRNIMFVPVAAGAVWRPFAHPPRPGDMLYRVATDVAAERVEALLVSGVDIAGEMVDHLAGKAIAEAESSPA